MRINLMLHSGEDNITVRVGAADTERPFTVITLGDLHVFMPGFGEECEARTRDLAAGLIKAADQIRASLIAQKAAEAALLVQQQSIAQQLLDEQK